ncbi:hypothetical protein PGT21_026435 [Puccinia graminis f. sp. tritici]|uniref:Uncharacterized protein n=1 Tax=Puccinia graminis f. sp. tritici TaxID=56615 RepID=A0A5B0R3A2_PUCGR|nr:hypothetical protein PGT21_026435 [Puccinia graminis f. sp. tritici]
MSSGSVRNFKPPVLNDPEVDLLQVQRSDGTSNLDSTLEHSTRNAVLVTGEAEKSSPGQFPQRAVVGSIVGQYAHGFPRIPPNPKLYLNVNTPFSTLICGVQGSGKSHSASVILEGCLIVDKRIGTLPKPLAGLCNTSPTRFQVDFISPSDSTCVANLFGNDEKDLYTFEGCECYAILPLNIKPKFQ